MKKILIITALFLSTGLTALSISRDSENHEHINVTTVAEKPVAMSTNLATAD